MLANLQRSLPFTLALAIIVYLLLLLIPDLALSASVSVAIGIVLGGVLVPILVEVKGASLDSTGSAAAAKTNYDGETATLYVGNLPYRANEDAVRELFQKFGVVVNVRLMKDRQTGRRRGFGFVEVAAKDANKMIQKLNDFAFQERTLKVREAKERQDGDDNDE
ncbi:RNA-binding protein [Rheinheimera sp. 1928-s]|uniref:RNA recognition motif domain-containing protein n=1 Tax=Rheinheimera sp. 1928-s TaxID=3033803 RepID=UPI00263407B3|nr:RNA-binding protein [Rheinheimera sp. 1928-s]MDF3126881.1 RNA-binding protein [Rheinheimera sp. 1928-s]